MKPYLQPAFLLRFSIALAYIILGIVIFFLPIERILLNLTTKILFALLLMLYGIFRLYRAFRTLKNEE
ncbi:MAG TPA: hypothetical protein PLJ42_08370 [Chitinophagales bacterium]|jgi:uncharacterized membrane protein HdeD (DUF308 family)|nr:hypothetical protein [Chitinophagales bacterium]MBP6154251.1 hypothetical protein [Chitinophagales bacterium]HQV78283.1 hypothetical protein [Chitinophagales bacterium]HQW79434.1 hypothetical protein [Chitinophagales bacterium]HRB92486.1 hypothetical protein [Chitinophagales bacterium]